MTLRGLVLIGLFLLGAAQILRGWRRPHDLVTLWGTFIAAGAVVATGSESPGREICIGAATGLLAVLTVLAAGPGPGGNDVVRGGTGGRWVEFAAAIAILSGLVFLGEPWWLVSLVAFVGLSVWVVVSRWDVLAR